MIYLIDSSCFMTASRVTYPIDIAVSFWNKISELAQFGAFYSIDKVENEIKINDDMLSSWCSENLPKDFFISTETEEVYKKYAELANWAQSKGINQSGVDKFIDAEKADIYFVAFCSLNSDKYTVVTEEVSAVNSKKDIKLPDACNAFGVRSINFMQVLRELKVQF